MQVAHVAQTDTTAQATDYPQWVIVENAGTDVKGVWSDHHTLRAALKELGNCGGMDNGFDLMECLPDGALTMEF